MHLESIIEKYLINEMPPGHGPRGRILTPAQKAKEKERKAKEKAKKEKAKEKERLAKEREKAKKLATEGWKLPTPKAFLKMLYARDKDTQSIYFKSMNPESYISTFTWKSRFMYTVKSTPEREALEKYFKTTPETKLKEVIKKFLENIVKELGGKDKFENIVKKYYIEDIKEDIKDDVRRMKYEDPKRDQAACALACLDGYSITPKINLTLKDLEFFDYLKDIKVKESKYDEFISMSARASVQSMNYVFDLNCTNTKVRGAKCRTHLGTHGV